MERGDRNLETQKLGGEKNVKGEDSWKEEKCQLTWLWVVIGKVKDFVRNKESVVKHTLCNMSPILCHTDMLRMV